MRVARIPTPSERSKNFMLFRKYVQSERQFTSVWLQNQSGSGRGYLAIIMWVADAVGLP